MRSTKSTRRFSRAIFLREPLLVFRQYPWTHWCKLTPLYPTVKAHLLRNGRDQFRVVGNDGANRTRSSATASCTGEHQLPGSSDHGAFGFPDALVRLPKRSPPSRSGLSHSEHRISVSGISCIEVAAGFHPLRWNSEKLLNLIS